MWPVESGTSASGDRPHYAVVFEWIIWVRGSRLVVTTAISVRVEMRDEQGMARAIELAQCARLHAPPNPWVGCVIASSEGVFEGATSVPGGPHAEAAALQAAGERARGATMYVTLEPCAHTGRTPPCTSAIIDAGISRVVVGAEDPDLRVSGRGIAVLGEAGVNVVVGVLREAVEEQLAPYLKHRRTNRPWVVLKLAATMDGRLAATDGTSKWITGPEARSDVARLRLMSDAVLVGAGTIRTDDPSLTVRLGAQSERLRAGEHEQPDEPQREPLRVVLGRVPEQAKVRPAIEMEGDLGAVLDRLGSMGVLQLMVEGGARVAHAFHASGLADRYVLYLAPALFGGDDAVPMFRGEGAISISDLWRGRLISVERLGDDLRVDLAPVLTEPGAQWSYEREMSEPCLLD